MNVLYKSLERIGKPDWILQKKDYSIRFEIIDGDILYSEAWGSLKEHYIKDFFDLYRRVLDESGLTTGDKSYFRILNWEGMRDVSWKARKLYLDGLRQMNREFPCRLSVVFGLNKFMGSIMNISKQFTPFHVTSAKNLEQALDIVARTKKGKEPSGKKIEKTRKKKTYSQADLNCYIDELLVFMGDIDWNVDKLQKKTRNPGESPFSPLL